MDNLADELRKQVPLRPEKQQTSLHDKEWESVYEDDMWYLWCIISDYRKETGKKIMDLLDYSTFCEVCSEFSS